MRLRRATPWVLSLMVWAGLFGISLGEAGAAIRTNRPPDVSTSSFNAGFAVMKRFKALVAAGHGEVAAILPDTVSSTRYLELDQPDIAQALTEAGLKSRQFVVQNALGSDATQLADAQTDIADGATVLIVDPLDWGVGAQIETYAKAHGVKVIDYDRLTLGGSREFYVGFNDVLAGKIMGNGLVGCAKAWHIPKPHVVVMRGAVTDNNATLLARGYDSVINPYFKSKKWALVTRTAGTWDPNTAVSEFETVMTAHPNTDAALIPNDETAAPIITYLQARRVKPRTFLTTGQDATLTGLQNVLSGYQCGTIYKPISLEAQAAAALALSLRAGVTPPKSLVNGKTEDTTSKVKVPSVLLPPKWVTTKNMNATVVKDGSVPAAELCAGPYAADCAAAGVTP